MNIIEQMLKKYNPKSETELINALKEIFQEITLLGLYRGGFFNKAAFYGGTSLRILYGLERFSEDLDFSLLEKNKSFDIEKYFPNIVNEFEALGIEVSLNKKSKSNETNIESAFLKNDTSIHTLNIEAKGLEDIHNGRRIKIKLEVDTNPPLKFQTESKTLLLPMTFNIRTMTLPNLYAGKMHTLLFRNWKTRVKGRDWFDFEWYIKNNISLNLDHLCQRMKESGNFNKDILTKEEFAKLLHDKIDTLDIKQAINEVKGFVKDARIFDFWSKDYFKLLASRVVFSS
ncbi:nucleotidyl transferase AbiEii/AbiGii toxin family protein [Helicobacter rodentium]|uniref:nucleotidyl transferase AbiEii/AbiGii toxin family protein n=1 Tax=Helicobacter rodentium TaxID=59617 RepID=UPI0023EFDCB9|nr:nucleotidyl transferase AbiEii/AbiGii toxin family protein [Helicobacter rodentium]